jgi:hypothetical protein
MATLDVFKADGFSTTSLSAAISEFPFQPMKVESLGLFRNIGGETTSAMIEKQGNTLSLVPSSARGGPGYAINDDLRNVRIFNIPHYPLKDAVMADEVQNIRAFGSMTELETVQSKVNKKMQKGATFLDMTVEWQRLGALKGIVYDARPVANTTGQFTLSELYNYYTEFEVSQQVKNFNFSDANLKLIPALTDVIGMIEDELGALMYQRIHALVGLNWFNALTSHPNYEKLYTYFNRPGGEAMTTDRRYTGVTLGNITFEVYRGRISGQDFISPDEGYAFPIGVPDLFLSIYAPAPYMETVNTEALPRYAKMEPMPFDKGMELEMQTNHLPVNTRPRTVVKLTKT